MKVDEKISVVIADDSPTFIEGILLLLEQNEDYKVIGVFNNGQQLIDSPVIYSAKIILVDIEMPELNGMEAAKIINRQNHNILLVAVTMHKDKVYLDDLVQSGFKGFVYKPNVAVELFDVMHKVLNKQFVFPFNIKLH